MHIYHFDSVGRRIQHDINSKASTTTLWNSWMPIAQLQHDGQSRLDSITWLTTDHIATPGQGTDRTGQPVWRCSSDAFGASPPNTHPDGNGRHTLIENRFAGQYHDTEPGLHYNGFRYYNPDTGRYMSSDPIGLSDRMNTYGYTMGNPLLFLDIFGMKSRKYVLLLSCIFFSYNSGIPISIYGADTPSRSTPHMTDSPNSETASASIPMRL